MNNLKLFVAASCDNGPRRKAEGGNHAADAKRGDYTGRTVLQPADNIAHVSGPPGFRDRLTQVLELFFPGSSSVRRKFMTEIREIDAGETAVINGVTVPLTSSSMPVVRRRSPYASSATGDTEWAENLLAVGCGADLLIADALFFERRVRYHLDYATLKAKSCDRLEPARGPRSSHGTGLRARLIRCGRHLGRGRKVPASPDLAS